MAYLFPADRGEDTEKEWGSYFPQIAQIGSQMNADFWFCAISDFIRDNQREVFNLFPVDGADWYADNADLFADER